MLDLHLKADYGGTDPKKTFPMHLAGSMSTQESHIDLLVTFLWMRLSFTMES